MGLLCAALVLGAGTGLAAAEGAGRPATDPGLVAAARAAVEADPRNVTAKIRLADQLAASGALEEALRYYDEVLADRPHASEAKTGRGVVLAKMGRLKEAEQVLLGALVLNPNPARVHYELGRLYQAQGEYEKALQQFKEGLRKHEIGR